VSEAWVIERLLVALGAGDGSPLLQRVRPLCSFRSNSGELPQVLQINGCLRLLHLSAGALKNAVGAFLAGASAVLLLHLLLSRAFAA
ncbi:hypothetical protein cyc_09244, partial [Cyclospora cayetanensis]